MNFNPLASISTGIEYYFANFKFKPHKALDAQEVERELQQRLELFGTPGFIIEKVKQGKVFKKLSGEYYEIKDSAELAFIHRLEKKYDIKIYLTTKDEIHSTMEEGWRYFYIGCDKTDWEFDKVDIQIHNPMCFKYRIVYDERKEFAEPLGGLDRHEGLFGKEHEKAGS